MFNRLIFSLLVLISLAASGCLFSRPQPVNGIHTSKNINSTDAGLIGNLKDDVAAKNKEAIKGDRAAITASQSIQANHSLMFLMLTGVVLTALGIAVALELSKGIGGLILCFGTGLVSISLLVQAIMPWMPYIAATVCIGSLVYWLIRLRLRRANKTTSTISISGAY